MLGLYALQAYAQLAERPSSRATAAGRPSTERLPPVRSTPGLAIWQIVNVEEAL